MFRSSFAFPKTFSYSFGNINIERVTKTCSSPHASDGAMGLITGTPVLDAISEIDATAPDHLIALATTKIAQLYGDNPSVSEMNAMGYGSPEVIRDARQLCNFKNSSTSSTLLFSVR